MADEDYGRVRLSCVRCASAFAKAHKGKMYCSQTCKKRDWYGRVGYRPKPKTVSPYFVGVCVGCGGVHGSRRAWELCPACKDAQSMARVKAVRDAAVRAIHRAQARETVCAKCGLVFCPLYGHSNAVLCSCCVPLVKIEQRRVSKAKRRAVERGVEAEAIDPIRVFDRDAWHCKLCGIKTPKSDRGSYKDTAPELDHIIPLSKGGAHRYTNVQCACRLCNQEKSDRPLGQLLLIG